MIRGKLVLILSPNGDCVHSPEFNGDMDPSGRGGEALEMLTKCSSLKEFRKICIHFIRKYHLDDDYDKQDLKDGTFLRGNNVVETDFTYGDYWKNPDGSDNYYAKWFSNYLYVLNLSGEAVVTKISNEDHMDTDHVFPNNTVTVLFFGKFQSEHPCHGVSATE